MKMATREVLYDEQKELWVIRSGGSYACLSYTYCELDEEGESELAPLFSFGYEDSTIMIFKSEQKAEDHLDFYRKKYTDRRTIMWRNWRDARVAQWDITECGSRVKCT